MMAVVRKKREKVALVACNRCKARKQRCDASFDKSCITCQKAGVPCEFNEKQNPNYVKILQQKVTFLEAKVRVLEERKSQSASPELQDCTTSETEFITTSSKTGNLVQYAANIPLSSDIDSLYVGSSGLSIASLLQAFIKNEQRGQHSNSQQQSRLSDLGIDEFSDESPNKSSKLLSLDELLENDLLMDHYVENYLSIIQIRYPFLEVNYVKLLHTERAQLFSKYPAFTQQEEGGADDDQLTTDRFTLLMVYAIGARLKTKKVISKEENQYHLVFYNTASSMNLEKAFALKNITGIHAMLLMVIYQLRFTNGVLIWHLVGSAMRLCVDFGLHRRNFNLLRDQPYQYLIRCRVFWSVYALERVIANSFGRPFSISDQDIDVDLPIDIDDSVTDEEKIKAKFYQTYPNLNLEGFKLSGPPNHSERTSMTVTIHLLKLRRIDSKIQNRIYRVDKEFNEVPYSDIYDIQSSMKTWIRSMPQVLDNYEYDYFCYLFNKAVRNLILPFINRLGSNDELFKECMKSTITVCKLSKKIHQNTNRFISFVSLQTVFLSGITIIYALLAKKIEWNFEVSEGLRCCTAVLVLIAERSEGLSKYHDVFDNLLDQVSTLRESNMDSSPRSGKRSLVSDSIEVESSGNLATRDDLFGQEFLKRKITNTKFNKNLQIFNELTRAEGSNELKEFDTIFNFSNLDQLYEKLGNLNSNPTDWGIDFL